MATISAEGKAKLDALLAQAAAGGKLPGFVVGATNLDEEIYFHGELGVTPDNIFWICSQTKLIAALAALKLIDLGKLSYETLVSDYFPAFKTPVIVDDFTGLKTPNYKPAQTPVTVKHLLSFSSGLFYPSPPAPPPFLASLPKAYTSKEMHQGADPVDEFFKILVGDLPGVPLQFEPGTNFVYGFNSDVLGFLVEKISGQTLDQFCQVHIFGPIGITASFYLTPELKQKAVALSFRQPDGSLTPLTNQLPLIEQDPSKVRVHLGGVGAYTSMRDYLKIFRHLLQINAGRPVENPILKKETVQSIFVPLLPPAGEETLKVMTMTEGVSWSNALAVHKTDLEGRRRAGSAFWGGWLGTAGFIDPATGIAVVSGVQIAHGYQDIEAQTLWVTIEAALYSVLQNKA